MARSTDIFLARPVRGNRGDFASQAGILAGLRRSGQVRRVYISTYYPHHFRGFRDVVPVSPAPLRGYLTHKRERGLLRNRIPVYWGGGVDLQDSGSRLKLLLLSIRMRLLKLSGSRLVMAFQGAGPINSDAGRMLVRQVCKCLDFVIVREPTAEDLLRTIGEVPSDRMELAVDGALLLDPPPAGADQEYLREHGLDPSRPILGVNLRRWFHQRGGWLPTELHQRRDSSRGEDRMARLVENVAHAIAGSGKFEQVLLLPMYRRQPEMWEDDILLLERLKSHLPSGYNVVAVEEDLSALELVSIFSALDLVLGVRLHSTIMAHVAGVPAVHIAYEHKGREHFARMGMKDLVVGIETASEPGNADAIQELLVSVFESRDRIAEQVRKRCSILHELAQTSLERSIRSVLGDSAKLTQRSGQDSA